MSKEFEQLKESYEKSLCVLADYSLEFFSDEKPNFKDETLLNGLLIFNAILHDKMHECESFNKLSNEDKLEQATSLGLELRCLVLKYTDIDTAKLVNELYPDKV